MTVLTAHLLPELCTYCQVVSPSMPYWRSTHCTCVDPDERITLTDLGRHALAQATR